MISDTVDDITAALAPGKSVADLDEFLLPDLAMASRLLLNLILQLDAEPQSLAYSPQKIFLEGQIVARNKAMLQHFAKTTMDIKIEFVTFRGVIPALWVDPILIERAFFNVVVNAIKYGKPGTSIAVVPRANQSAYYIDVSNFGEGIEAGDEDRIFDRYFRATRRKVPGIGLGLYISRAAVEKNGAKLFVSRLADPTVFTFSFPRRFALSN
ncbi:MAG: ATP-binding protein [Planctomycetota bacterium]